MTYNLLETLHKMESKRSNGEKCSKHFSKIIERQNLKNLTISELYAHL